MNRLYHLALAGDWSSHADRAYEVSTIGVSLAEQGFIHCSFAHQVQQVADLFYRGRSDVVLLEIDESRLRAPVEVEGADGGEAFPHIYGPLNRDAVVSATPVRLMPDGRLDLTDV